MYDDDFKLRLAQLRVQKGISARDMSLSLGQNPGYINNIETGKALPSMSAFFYICDYLDISPKEFFDNSAEDPETIRNITADLKQLSQEQLKNVASIVKGLIH